MRLQMFLERPCPVLEKFERRIAEVAVEMGCADSYQIDDLGAFCEPLLADRAAQDPDLVTERSTGELRTLCVEKHQALGRERDAPGLRHVP